MGKKEDYHQLKVMRVVLCSVAFNEAVTAKEALELYNAGDYQDITNEEILDEKAFEAYPIIQPVP